MAAPAVLLSMMAVAAASGVPGVPTGSGRPAHLTVRPASIYLGDISGAFLYGSQSRAPIHWRHWTATGATGRGIEKVNLCKPDCAAGHYGEYPVTITLSRPGGLASRRVFKRLDLHYTSRRRPPDARHAAHWVASRNGAYYLWLPRFLR